jgi:chromosome segregation protein
LPVSFSRLRIAGFKSFAEPAILEIRPGLTGIVGPNGCGKSNVVEALRWAMGESSARSLRGAEMDDVIFAGTAARPSRNIAEVTLAVDDAAGAAPPPFHEQPELEITRRIERGGGSVYRVNGREARARDVQTLFADLASGARTSAMVSQGRVGAIVAARPEERRALLEEAAGITGLHARRHEAELKLRAAEANLARAEDLRGQLEGQLESLKRQARQATRYRNLSQTIRAAEAEFLALQRARAAAGLATAASALHAARQAVAEATAAAAGAGARAAEAAASLPALRAAEAAARTALERHRVGLEAFVAEERRAAAALAEAEARGGQVARDLAHADQLARDAEAALARLAEDAARIAAENQAHPARMERAEEAAAAAAEAVRAAEAEANRATEHAAEIAARHRALTEALALAEQRVRRLEEQRDRLRAEQARVAAQAVDPARREAAGAELAAAEQMVEQERRAAEGAEQARAAALQHAAAARSTAQAAAEQARTQAHASVAAAREAATVADGARAKLAAEAQALTEILAVGDGDGGPRLIDALAVPAGLEAALGVALGADLEASADGAAPRHFRPLPPLEPMPALPAGCRALSGLVTAPAALGRALSQIGLADTAAQAAAAQAALLPGQSVVCRAGGLWRWDGYTVVAGTPSEAAVRLQQRNRLAELRERLAQAEQVAGAAQAARAEAEAAEQAARRQAEADERAARAGADAAEREATENEGRARATRREAEQRLERARTAANQLAAQATGAAARLAALEEQATRLEADGAEAAVALRRAREAVAGLADPAAARAAMERARTALGAARNRETAARADREALARAAGGRAQRVRTLTDERQQWTLRAADARGRVTDLAARAEEVRASLAALQAEPGRLAARRAAAMTGMEQAEAAHRVEADALLRSETAAAAAERAARAAEAALAASREAVIRAEGEHGQAEQAMAAIAERILDRLGASPALPDPPADLGAEGEDRARRRLERLLREREEMGPVNLRAEVEAEDVAAQIGLIVHEREELATAIAKLRGSIGHLNREGRERLSQVFAEVDRNFQALFARNFGGGKAHLALVGSDDPLLAGLEIYAQPPGKKLAALSLLSGGEQALTALSLIFAVFRCNPAPICVLDEVDAPLDDANVDRFCGLLDDMVRETGTRFLVVTHHHLTMARMDRLYGVTMQERGISRLLSVDLRQAADMVEAVPRMAAE